MVVVVVVVVVGKRRGEERGREETREVRGVGSRSVLLEVGSRWNTGVEGEGWEGGRLSKRSGW
jgi:hypothetical protein